MKVAHVVNIGPVLTSEFIIRYSLKSNKAIKSNQCVLELMKTTVYNKYIKNHTIPQEMSDKNQILVIRKISLALPLTSYPILLLTYLFGAPSPTYN